MRSLSFYYDTSLTFSEPIKEHDFLLRCVPEQRITEFTLTIVPMDRGGRYGTDAFGNRTYKGCIPAPHMSFRYTVRGRAVRDDSAKQREDTVLPGYKYPSRLTEPTDEMKDFLASLPPFGDGSCESTRDLDGGTRAFHLHSGGDRRLHDGGGSLPSGEGRVSGLCTCLPLSLPPVRHSGTLCERSSCGGWGQSRMGGDLG